MKKIILIMVFAIVLLLTACTPSDAGFNLDSNITVYTRDTTSGTRDGFMNGIGFAEAAKSDSVLVTGFVIRDNTAQLNAMSIDEFGIGYISTSSLNNTVKGLYFNGVEPTEANVINNTYDLKRPFMWMIRAVGDFPSQDVEDLVHAFVAFLGTTDAADIINNSGAIALPSSITWDSIKNDFPITQQDNSSITVRFGGSDSIQKIAEAVTAAFTAKAGNFVAEHDHTGSGDGWKRTNGDTKDQTVGKDVGFSSRPFTTTELSNVIEEQYGQLAWDAIVAIVHLSNPINNVTADTLKKIYEGTYLTWSDVPNE
ncbi:substrate-binding domain-containing protein [Peloplasma aerotolerans]|uniref:Substrate-binding domain-containing protein n=1 Tax=Peloplasma aerotolerans TaxID=3044389 RepID=A0AAW6U8I4_9MOLU|nr:substrate-binding domain-containing protein [Mariniplasma sp. M4Ah]MDI6452969.1 substrate-binding domain-containing protein [Mariniplasma sp. M4Ah]